jgi:hypothetical protein
MSHASFYKKCLGALMFAVPSVCYAGIGDGPRAYLPPPVNSNVFSFYGMDISGNSVIFTDVVNPNLTVDTSLGVMQYTRTMDLFDRYTSLTIVQPFGEVTSTVDFDLGPNNGISFDSESKSSGLGDSQLLLTFGLYNLPPLTVEEYRSFKPELAFGGLVRLTLPSGEYDANSQVNMGTNRYSLQLGMPITYAIGTSFVDPHLTTFDLLPSLTLFGDNDDLSNGDSSGQDILYKLEGHITHNFNAGLWGSLDAIYTYGGETDIDSVNQGNNQRSLGVGVTAGINFSKKLGLKASYAKVIERNESGMDGDMIRLTLTYTKF